MKTFVPAVTCALALLLGACTQAPPPVDKAAIEKQIRDLEATWSKEAGAKDIGKWMSHYTADAIVAGGGVPAAKGTDAIHAMLTELTKDPNMHLEFAPSKVEVADAGDTVATAGSYALKVTDPLTQKPIDDKGTYVTVYHKQADGSWKASMDLTASEVPPPAPPRAHAAATKKKAAKRRK